MSAKEEVCGCGTREGDGHDSAIEWLRCALDDRTRKLEEAERKLTLALGSKVVEWNAPPGESSEQRCDCGQTLGQSLFNYCTPGAGRGHKDELVWYQCALVARTRELARDRAIAEAAREWYAMLCDDKTPARQRWEAEGRLVDRILEQTP